MRTIIDEKLIDAWTVLVMADRRTIKEVPEKYREEVEIRKAERTIEVLGGDGDL